LSKKANRLALVLPDGMRDSILSLPFLLCLKQLLDRFQTYWDVTVYAPRITYETIWAMGLFEVTVLDLLEKYNSWFRPFDKAFFLQPSIGDFGLRAKRSYRKHIISASKADISYSHEREYTGKPICQGTVEELIDFLHGEQKLPLAAARLFNLLRDLDYTVEQIRETFNFSVDNSLELSEKINTWVPLVALDSYLVFCAETSYGGKREEHDRWPLESFLEMADYVWRKYKLLSVFVGLDKGNPKLPAKDYLIDLRGRLKVTTQLAQLMRFAQGYIGNGDAGGPIHLANLMKTPTLGIYLGTDDSREYGPIFDGLHIAIEQPEEIPFAEVDRLVAQKKNHS